MQHPRKHRRRRAAFAATLATAALAAAGLTMAAAPRPTVYTP
ncbi:hypothetical protein AB0C98_16995 [Streptomyces sp. NPDC048558]